MSLITIKSFIVKLTERSNIHGKRTSPTSCDKLFIFSLIKVQKYIASCFTDSEFCFTATDYLILVWAGGFYLMFYIIYYREKSDTLFHRDELEIFYFSSDEGARKIIVREFIEVK